MRPDQAFDMDRLSEMLHRGNSAPPWWCRYEFYEAKKRLLLWLGSPMERDIQEIKKSCWGCGGGGTVGHYDDECDRCRGTGVYTRRLVWLDKYRFGSHTFHVPSWVIVLPGTEPTIRGLIHHTPYDDSADCAVSIAWLFNRDGLRSAARNHAAYEIGWSRGTGQAWFDVATWCREANAEWAARKNEVYDSIPF